MSHKLPVVAPMSRPVEDGLLAESSSFSSDFWHASVTRQCKSMSPVTNMLVQGSFPIITAAGAGNGTCEEVLGE